MDLIFMNSEKEDVGVLMEYDLDLAFGADENDFECQINSSSHCCQSGWYLYIEETEYGGIIDKIKVDTGSNVITYSGRTWHGILDSKILEPDNGQGYLIVKGEANDVLASLLSRMMLSDLFEAASEDSGFNIQSYQMNRYITGYKGITKMLDSVGAKLQFKFRGGKVILSAVPKYDYTQDEEFDSDLVDFTMERKYRTVNHLICLGKGELAERLVVHLYANEKGEIGNKQIFYGIDEYAAVLDYPSAESEEDLVASGTEKLKELWEPSNLQIGFDADSNAYDVGDTVGAYDNITGITVAASVSKKIVSIKDGKITIEYKVGE